ncbi:MAG: ferredoxin family protein [Bacteroidales bacterium]|jgi:ferredoxin|nr:ferredoxin family protein [Bacteroidales bacterium]
MTVNVVYIGTGMMLILLITSSLYRKQKRKGKVVCVVESICTGCRRCVKKCARHVLETATGETGIHAVVKYPDKCSACGDCLGKCKFNALKLVERI